MARFSSSISITRVNDTNAYGAADVVGAATGSTAAKEFAGVGQQGGGPIVIRRAEIRIDASAVIASETSYTLYLYSQTPPSAYGDNTTWDLPSGDRASFLGLIPAMTPVDVGSTLYVQSNDLWIPMMLTGASLFAYLVTTAAHTPTAQRVYNATLHVER